MIIDLSIKDNDDRRILVKHGLRTATQIDDAQAPVRKTNRASHKVPMSVGTPMNNAIAHPMKPSFIGKRLPVEIQNPCDSTHNYLVH